MRNPTRPPASDWAIITSMSTTAATITPIADAAVPKRGGPRSSEGKSMASRNSTRHGLSAEKLVALPSEDEEELKAFASELRNSLAPEGAFERLLADRIVMAAVRLRRAGVFERGILLAENGQEDLGRAFFRDASKADTMGKLGRYIRDAEASIRSNSALLERAQARRAGVAVPVPAVLDVMVTSTTEGGSDGR